MYGGDGKYFICVMSAIEALLDSVMKSTICNYCSLKYYSIKKTMCVLSSKYLLIYTAQKRLKVKQGSWWVELKIFSERSSQTFFERTIINKPRSLTFTFPKQTACDWKHITASQVLAHPQVNSLALAYPGEESSVTGSHMTSCNQGASSKQQRKHWEWDWRDFCS